MINFCVGGETVEGFWDTESIISLISKEWLNKQFHNMKIEPLGIFLDTKTSDIKFRAADNNELDMEGIVTFIFVFMVTLSEFVW